MQRLQRLWPLCGLLLLLVAGSFTLSGCDDIIYDDAFFRVINLAPGNETAFVDVFLDDALFILDLAYDELTDYFRIREGDYFFAFSEAGRSPFDDFDSFKFDLDGNDSYTFYIVGGDTAPGGPRVLVLEDGGPDPALGNIQFRALHGAPSVSQADVYIRPAGAPLTLPATFPGLGVLESTNYIELPEGLMQVSFVIPCRDRPQRSSGHRHRLGTGHDELG